VQGQLVDVLRNIGEAEPLPLAKAWNPETGVPRESQGDRQAARSPVDGDLETIVHKAMAKEPQRRYPSMEAFAEDVRRYLDGRPILAKRDSALYVLRKRIRRNRSRVAVAVFTTVLLGVTIGVLSMQGPSRPPLAPELLQRFDAAEIEYVEVRGELLDVIEKREAGGDSLMTPGTLESLRILQDATGELRRAIERDPQSPELRELLMATFAKELGLLRRICSISG
jgi:serine/threonine-protein kinase